MKKIICCIVLSVMLFTSVVTSVVTPVFAQQGDGYLDFKVGAGLNNNFKVSYSAISKDTDVNIPVSLGLDVFYEFIDNLSVGLGATYTFDSKEKISQNLYNERVGTTNIFFAVKPEIQMNSLTPTTIYVIGQVGISMLRVKDDTTSLATKPGLYLGIGIGTVIDNRFILELLYSQSNADYKFIEPIKFDLKYSALTLSIGYKLSL